MRHWILTGCAFACTFAIGTEDVLAHGGTYRGPGDVTPDPTPGGRSPTGPSTPRDGSPTTPGPSGPGTGSSGSPFTPGTGPTGPGGSGPGTGPGTGGAAVGPDLTAWEFWWEFNKDPFINLRRAVHDPAARSPEEEIYTGAGHTVLADNTLAPTKAQVMEVLAALKRALDTIETRTADVPSSCLVAMAKIGRDHPEFDILPVFRKYISSPNQEIRETAALAIGISQQAAGLRVLTDLVLDTAAGREAVDRGRVGYRTRSFAAYGLGLIAWSTSDTEVKERVFRTLDKILSDAAIDNRNIRVAAINALGLLQPVPTSAAGTKLLTDSITSLRRFFAKNLGTGEKLIQAHVPTAIAKLLDHDGIDRTSDVFLSNHEFFVQILEGRSPLKVTNEIEQSVAIAIGRMSNPPVDAGARTRKQTLDGRAFDALTTYFERGKDQQARYFSLMALGDIGGDTARSYLARVLERGTKVLERPWAALALGVSGHHELEASASAPQWIDQVIGPAVFDQFRSQKEPRAKSAMAVSLGLLRYVKSSDTLRATLLDQAQNAPLNGYLCLGLALMGDRSAKPTIRQVIDKAVYRQDLLRQAAVALGKLGDKGVSQQLQGMLADGDLNLAKMSSVAAGLGLIGDRDSIGSLLSLLFDEELTELTRAFAAVALGSICDKELLVWNSKIAVDTNYRASVETLTNQVNGILDIL